MDYDPALVADRTQGSNYCISAALAVGTGDIGALAFVHKVPEGNSASTCPPFLLGLPTPAFDIHGQDEEPMNAQALSSVVLRETAVTGKKDAVAVVVDSPDFLLLVRASLLNGMRCAGLDSKPAFVVRT